MRAPGAPASELPQPAETLASCIALVRDRARNRGIADEQLYCDVLSLVRAMERGTAGADVVAQADALRRQGRGYRELDVLDHLALAARHYAKGERVQHATTVASSSLDGQVRA